jgi:hypothetical protein
MKYKGIRQRQKKHYSDEKRRLPPIAYIEYKDDVVETAYDLLIANIRAIKEKRTVGFEPTSARVL